MICALLFQERLPGVPNRQVSGEPRSSLLAQSRQYMARIHVILRPNLAALVEHLQFWRQIGNAFRALQESFAPFDTHRRIASIDQACRVTVADGQVEAPGPTFIASAPDVVLLAFDKQVAPVPARQVPRSGDMWIPHLKNRPGHSGVLTKNPDIGVVMVSPRISDEQLESQATCYPPATLV